MISVPGIGGFGDTEGAKALSVSSLEKNEYKNCNKRRAS